MTVLTLTPNIYVIAVSAYQYHPSVVVTVNNRKPMEKIYLPIGPSANSNARSASCAPVSSGVSVNVPVTRTIRAVMVQITIVSKNTSNIP